MGVLMLTWFHACHVISNSFQVNIFIFNLYTEGPNTQTGKVFGIKILKNKGSKGGQSWKQPFSCIFFIFIFFKSFRFLVLSKEYSLKIMVSRVTFWLLIRVLWAWILQLFKSWKNDLERVNSLCLMNVEQKYSRYTKFSIREMNTYFLWFFGSILLENKYLSLKFWSLSF